MRRPFQHQYVGGHFPTGQDICSERWGPNGRSRYARVVPLTRAHGFLHNTHSHFTTAIITHSDTCQENQQSWPRSLPKTTNQVTHQRPSWLRAWVRKCLNIYLTSSRWYILSSNIVYSPHFPSPFPLSPLHQSLHIVPYPACCVLAAGRCGQIGCCFELSAAAEEVARGVAYPGKGSGQAFI